MATVECLRDVYRTVLIGLGRQPKRHFIALLFQLSLTVTEIVKWFESLNPVLNSNFNCNWKFLDNCNYNSNWKDLKT